jgi:hypothetical protein
VFSKKKKVWFVKILTLKKSLFENEALKMVRKWVIKFIISALRILGWEGVCSL